MKPRRHRPISRLEIEVLQLSEANIQYEATLQEIIGTAEALAHNCNGSCPICRAHRVLTLYCSDYDPADPVPWSHA